MAIVTEYGFSDTICVIAHPAFPSNSFNGQGVKSLAISYDNDNTAHDLAADGSVMVSKIRANTGTITLVIQQSSPIHKYLKQMFNIIQAQPTILWASAIFTISSPAGLFDSILATGVSLLKRADQPYQQQGQDVTWTFKVANLSYQF